MRIDVLEFDQAPGEVPRRNLNHVKAEILVKKWRWAVRVNRTTIKLIVSHTWAVIKAAVRPELPKTFIYQPTYIPATLPPPEVPGVVFKEPVSSIWRKDPSSPSLAVRFLPFEEMQANLLGA
jgi:hypothetical protein